jgi:hypothetical protein
VVWTMASLLIVSQPHLLSALAPPCFPSTRQHCYLRDRTTIRPYSSSHNDERNNNGDLLDDETLLRTVTKLQLAQLCQNLQLSSKGDKITLLERLREHANKKAQEERRIALERAERVEQGTDNAKERYEIIQNDGRYTNNDDDDDDDDDSLDDAFFYFALPDDDAAADNSPSSVDPPPPRRLPSMSPARDITAPPPPKEPNADGERVVTIYNTAEQNDLTGIAASQPGQAAWANDNLMNVMSSSSSGSSSRQPWDMPTRATITSSAAELATAKETVSELVALLLAMTGAPAFTSRDDDDDDDLMQRMPSYYTAPARFVGFDPSQVPIELLAASSQALRMARGQVLQDVCREFELQGIAQDGMASDNVEKGGGHYREVSKVHAFLDGYRRAEIRRLARETSVMLLDKLVVEGLVGLDMTMAAMSRSSDDTAAHAGELNDSLLDYLNEAIRQQERKVDQLVAARLDKKRGQNWMDEEESDLAEGLWNVTREEDGQRIESIDPNDPKVLNYLQQEQNRNERSALSYHRAIPESAPEKILLLLTLLRERIKAEAAFAPDEKGRNLRLLAYCLQLDSDEEREQQIMKDVGNSVEVGDCGFTYANGRVVLKRPRLTIFFQQRLDSFLELVASSIEYGQSTSYQLQPAKKISLNVKQLKNIKDLVEHLCERQGWRAA